MRRWGLGLKWDAVTVLALSGTWFGLFHLFRFIRDQDEGLVTPMLVGMLVVPAFLLGLSARRWQAIVISPLAYLLAWTIPVAVAGFNGLPGDAGWLGLAVFQLALCVIMAGAFALGRGLGGLVAARQAQ